MAKARKAKRKPISDQEKQALRALKLVGLDAAIGTDEHKRDRVIAGGNRRQFDIGSMKSVVRVRNVDPLVGMSSLSWQQRKAGNRYRDDFETVEREGIKPASWEIRVDGSGGERERAERIAKAHSDLAKANRALGYDEIQRTVESICGLGFSVAALAKQDGNPRDVVAFLLGIGLQKLAVEYGIVSPTK